MTVRNHRQRWVAGGLGLLVLGGSLAYVASGRCLSAWVFQGVEVPRCPDGKFRQTAGVSAHGLARGASSRVSVWADAHAVDERGNALKARVGRGSTELFLVDAAGKETPLPVDAKSSWKREGNGPLNAPVTLPQVPDGDYQLRARITTPLGTDTVDAPLPLYAPARVRVLTDRPLYEPGHRVRFRAVALRAKDLSPLDGRPGTWSVKDPTGEVVLEERAPAGPWGVVAGDLPLDRGAPTGDWTVAWTSGGASGEAHFTVEPFTLPRMRLEARSPKPFWRANETPEVTGEVAYASGAPVADTDVALEWSHAGAWPPPTEWLRGELPKKARTDAAGRFRVTLPRVPADLRGQSTLSARVEARDATGEPVRGAVSLLLSEDALAVSAVTELEDGLVAGFSNRVYLRATTASGRVLPGAEVTVTRAWDPKDPGVSAVADEDGVAAFQMDPGPAVNVVVPPLPVRPIPRPPPVSLASSQDLLNDRGGQQPALADQLALERLLPAFHPCARFVASNGAAMVALAARVGPSGQVLDVAGADEGTGACMASVLKARGLPPGAERMLALQFRVMDPGLPSLQPHVQTATGNTHEIEAALSRPALDARACLPLDLSGSSTLPAVLTWRQVPGKRDVVLSWLPLPARDTAFSAAVLPCLKERFSRLRLPSSQSGEAVADGSPVGGAMGVVRFSVQPPWNGGRTLQAQATTFLGYELKVKAKWDGQDVGDTKLVLRPARLPPLRLRATPVLAKAGEAVKVELLRGPGFVGELPRTLELVAGSARLKAEVDAPSRSARFTLPADFEGWAHVEGVEAQARVYVAPRAQLAVEVSPDKPAYAPGELAHLQVHTVVDGKEGPAAVGLFGVDETLSQLAPLPGADALEGLRPAPTVATPAFGVLDGQALAMGRIRGANAAAAALLRVTEVPKPEELEARVTANATSPFSPDAELTEPFYAVLTELHARTRKWEETAPKGETLDPAGAARLWKESLEACEQRGEKVTDAFGRRLRLSRLPEDLLSLTDPRAVVVSGTRLPEDVVNWGAWVAQESP
ncbi:MG2 domain-containing protein [Corallococcus sp. bb12-1]|uniref:MG2 domain-containing protein n=1 Tax=Corallococcus sp. bb12-1 TaxID=2996784 RepID=UPI00226FCD4D|nr:MG2 domain-containing protein [Corallococcus sp. bb12-1]MCY1046351.1 MG2 domain-containing protein [Corallococcus sp. bb12-1]